MNQPEYKKINKDGIEINTVLIQMPKANLIIAASGCGFVMCGYLDISIAEKMGDIACVVSGVSTVDQMLEKPVVKLTEAAKTLGIELGMSGLDALKKMYNKDSDSPAFI